MSRDLDTASLVGFSSVKPFFVLPKLHLHIAVVCPFSLCAVRDDVSVFYGSAYHFAFSSLFLKIVVFIVIAFHEGFH